MEFDFLYFKSPYNPNNGIFLLQPYFKRFGTVKRLLSKHPRIEVARKHAKFGLITNLFTIKRKKTVLEFKSIILSDIHLGMRDCKAKEATHFLKHTPSETLLLIGDIIDAWSQRRRIGKLKSLYSPGYQENRAYNDQGYLFVREPESEPVDLVKHSDTKDSSVTISSRPKKKCQMKSTNQDPVAETTGNNKFKF